MTKTTTGLWAAAMLLLVAGAAQAKTADAPGLVADLSVSVGVNSHYGLGLATAPALGWRFDFPLELLVEPRFVFTGLADHGSSGAALLGKARGYLFPDVSAEAGAGAGVFFGWPGEEWPPVAVPWIVTAGGSWTFHRGGRTALDARCTVDFYSRHPADMGAGELPDSSSRPVVQMLLGLALRIY